MTYLAMLGYDGWVLPRDNWVPLAAFPLEAHQSVASYVVAHGLLRRVLPFRKRPRYVNSVLFLPDGRRPGSRRAEPESASVPRGRARGGPKG